MSKSEGQVLDFEKICRLCLLEKRSMSAIFSKKKSDKLVPLPVRIMSCASLELYEGDGLPASICSKCLLSVNQSYAFKEQCEQADTTLRQYAQRMNETTEDASMNKTGKDDSQLRIGVTWEEREEDLMKSNAMGVKSDRESIYIGGCDGKRMSDSNSVGLGGSEVSVDLKVKTISEIRTPHNESLREINLFEKLLNNKDVVVRFKESKEFLVTDEKDKWLIIRKLSQQGSMTRNEGSTEGKNKGKTSDVEENSILKCLESMVKNSLRKSNGSLVFCKECKIFMKKSSFSGHNRFVHKKIRKYLCQTCGYATHTGSILRQHIQAVHIGYTFECGECSKKFNLLKRLRKHRELHHSESVDLTEKKKICHYCGLSFFRLSYLKTHLLTHTGESPLKCQYCSRRFRFRWALIQHERLHTGVKPYKCRFCEETFTQNRVRKTHESRCHKILEETEVSDKMGETNTEESRLSDGANECFNFEIDS